MFVNFHILNEYNFAFLLYVRKGTLRIPETELDESEICDPVRSNIRVSMFRSYMYIDAALVFNSLLPVFKAPAFKYIVFSDLI